ncbi:hypothetical protein [Halarchaeum salinum]|uniref:Uncharacterized protein n=1 Tax=Halarchaeum salinum TaxID=489912 RepID=A0AAV3S5S3_9EURY
MTLADSVARAGRLGGVALLGCLAVLPLGVALLAVVPAWVAICLVVAGGAGPVAAVMIGRLPVPYRTFYWWALTTGVLSYGGWQLARLTVPPHETGVAVGYWGGAALLAVAVANYRRLWGVLVLD